jgi:hypothetical protein
MKFVRESRIAARPERVFAFHESPGAFQRLTPPWEHIVVESGGASIRPGCRVTLTTRLGPLRFRWVAEHTEYDPPRLFADRQLSGPFASWYHRHRMIDDGNGGTTLRDEVDYELPLGAIGRWIGSRYIRRKLNRMFDYRHEVTKRIVEAGDFPNSSSEVDV